MPADPDGPGLGPSRLGPDSERALLRFGRPAAFWVGTAAITTGVVLHLPMYAGARDMGYRLVGMPLDAPMVVGMALIVAGLAVTLYGLVPPRTQRASSSPPQVRALDDARFSGAHLALLLVMAAAVTIDVMKPVTLSFVVPGMTQEYGLASALAPGGGTPVAYLPLAGIVGTVVGSFVWGGMADAIGRRASIFFAAAVFIATSVCGAMPSFGWNVFMCFVMGLGVGGMLPIAFALMAEVIPARHRGWVMVLIGGDVAGAYIITSWLAAELTPTYGWRILWLLGLPTGLLLVLLNRWIPESPRFLIQQGLHRQAGAVMARYGAAAVEAGSDQSGSDQAGLEGQGAGGWRQLLAPPFRGITSVVALLGLGVGLVTFGFQLWIPTNLQRLGMDEVTSATVLRDTALFGFPSTFLVAWLYGWWSARRTTILLGLVTAASLAGTVVLGDALVADRTLLYLLLVVPITGISTLLAVLVAYASETFPTGIRSRGTGLAAGASKVGGVLVIGLVVAGVTAPSIPATAFIGAVPIAAGALAMALFGVETRHQSLEEITAGQLARGARSPEVGAGAAGRLG
ncbi:MAG: MFS transporter [Actinomycetota bacterium]|nr:MFS transporter [Actinomycetota bacterium]